MTKRIKCETMATNARLRELLKISGLSTTGSKKQLRERIAAAKPCSGLHPTQQSLWNHCINITQFEGVDK
jgi:hypothetical protein